MSDAPANAQIPNAKRYDTSTPARIDLSPAAIAARMRRLQELRAAAARLAEVGERHAVVLLARPPRGRAP